MKKPLLTAIAAIILCASGNAQNSLVGRVYHNENIMSTLYSSIDKTIEQEKAKAIAEGEKEKGRKLNAEETKELEEGLKEINAKLKIIKTGTSMGLTITFKNEKELTMKAKMKMTDEAMKTAGIGWAKRKALKAAMAVMPAETCPYKVQGNLVIVQDDKEQDTLRLSTDGKHLSGTYKVNKNDEPVKYTLTRTK